MTDKIISIIFCIFTFLLVITGIIFICNINKLFGLIFAILYLYCYLVHSTYHEYILKKHYLDKESDEYLYLIHLLENKVMKKND